MQPSHIFMITMLTISFWGLPLPAQTYESSVAELAQYLNTGNQSQKDYAMEWLTRKFQDGVDISAAVPSLRAYVKQNVNPEEPLGVNKYGPTQALLYLMHYGDSQAIEHYLVANQRQITRSQKTGKLIPLAIREVSEIPYLESIDPQHYEAAYEIFSPAWEQFQKLRIQNVPKKANQIALLSNAAPQTLHWLGRFATDKQPVVLQVNQWRANYQKYPNTVRWGYFLPVVIVLADQSELLPDLVSQVNRYPVKQLRKESSGTVAMVAAMAPFRTDARELFSQLLANPKLNSYWKSWIAIYVDSASRLKGEDHTRACQQLVKIAKPAYDKQKGGNGWFYYARGFQRPRFVSSREELQIEILKAFGEAALADKEQYIESLDLDSGLGKF